MDFASITGLVLGFIIILAALLFGGVPMATVFQPEAILIVFGGTITALLVHFSFEDIHEALASLGRVFQEAVFQAEEIRDYIVDAAIYIRTKGVLAVQPLLAQVEIPFLQRGLQMVVDNTPAKEIEILLSTEMEVTYQKECHLAKVFEVAGGVAPTMGIIGAVVGLIKVAGLFQSPEQLGPAIGAAFSATLYGVAIANLALLPIAGKIRQRARNEFLLKTLMLQGILAIREEENPSIIKERLSAYIYKEHPPSFGQQAHPVMEEEGYYDPVPGIG